MALTNPFITQTPSPTLIAGSPARITYTDLSYNVVPDISNNPTYTLRTTDPNTNNYDVFLQSQLAPQSFTPNRLFTNSNLNAPGGIVRDGSGNFYVVCLPDGAVGVPPDVSMYTSSGVFVRKITIEGGWTSLRYCGYDSLNNRLYVSGEDNNVGLAGVNLSFPFPSTNDPGLSIFGPSTPWVGLCRQPTYYNGYLYIAIKTGPPGYIIKYNLTTGDYVVLVATLAGTGEQPICIVINPTYVSGGNNFLYFGTVFNFSTDTHHIYAVSEITGVETSTGGTGIATITLFTTFTNSSVWGITADPSGNVYAAVVSFASFFSGPAQIARISPTDTTRQNLTGVSFGGTRIAGRIRGLLFDGSANLYIADESNDRVLLTQPKTFIFGGPTSIVNGEAYFNTDKRTTYLYDISNNEVDTSFLLNPAECFKKGTKILCENDIYIPIEELKIGDLVKTYKHGYQKVIRTANGRLCDYPQNTLNQLYTYSREKNPALIEDLHLTGGHSLLLDTLADEELYDMKQIHWLEDEYMVEDKYKLLACFSRDIHVSAEQNVEIYHFTLEPPENARPSYVYGVYANGILAESCSHGAMDKKLGENRILSSSTPVVIRPPNRFPYPLVYDDSIDTTNMTNVLLIDSNVLNNKEFYDSVNANTFPIIYNYNSSTDDLLALLRQKFSASSIQRIALVFHDKGPNSAGLFMNHKRLFENSDLQENQTSFTENVSFLISCIKYFHVANIDFLACNTLQYLNWKSYYALLTSQTSVVVGASNDATGNVQYGGDWVMESTEQDIKQIYFSNNIDYYKYLLADYTLNKIQYTFITATTAYVSGFDTGITTANIPSTITSGATTYNVTRIDSAAFNFATSLTSVIIPSSVTSIGSYAFDECRALNLVYFLQTPTLPTIGFDAFANIGTGSVGKYYSSVSDTSSIASLFSSISPISTTPLTLTSMTTFTSSTISYTGLVTNGNEAGGNPPYVFLVNSITGGSSLLIGATQGTATAWNASTNNTINSSDNAYWTPPTGTTGLLNAFSVVVQDAIGAVSSPNVQVDIFITPPTLTSITPFYRSTILYTGLVTNGNEVVSNTPFVFLVNSVTSGSLLIGATQGTATAWNASTNNTINQSNSAYWTPPTSTTGLLDAFSVVVQDNIGAVSSPNVQVQVAVATNIIVDGSTNSIYLQMLSGVMQYSIGTLTLPGSWTSIASGDWPLQITNSNSSSVLRVVATQNLTITGSYGGTLGFFVAGSTKITFDGSGNTITLDTITDYPGFIQNGISGLSGFANIIVQNFTTAISGGSTLASSAGWLCQSNFGYGASGNQIISCTNTGPIGGTYAGGIAGIAVGAGGGSVSFTRCANTGTISGNSAGGIVGGSAKSTTITNCFSIGIISGNGAGGIAGNWFGYNSNGTCRISNCYSTGAINGTNAGGIVGAGVGFTDNGTNISLYIVYCYSLGAISSTAGGICGGIDGSYVGTGNVYIQNSYSWGVLTTPGSGIVATSLPTTPITINQYGTYVANGAWSDTAANAGLVNYSFLGNNYWTKIANNTTTPYVLSSFNAQLYSPNSATTSASNYTTSAGLFTDPSYNYQIVYNNIFNNVVTTSVFVSKGTTSPYYYSYNTNTFTLTPTSSATYITNITITPSNGILNYLLTTSLTNPVITQTPSPTLIAGSPARITYTDPSYNIVPDISNNPTYTLRTTDPNTNNYDVFLQSQDAPQSFTPNSLFTNSNLRFPGGIVRDGSGNFYVVCLASSGNPPGVVMFTPAGTYIGRISIEGGYTALRYGGYDSLNNRLYVASETAGVGLVGINLSNPPPSSNNPALSILPNAPWAGACRQSVYKNGYLYIAVLYTPNILKYNLATNNYLVLDVSPVTSVGAVCLVLNPTYVSGGNNLLYVGTSGGVIYAVSEITGTEISTGGTGIATLTMITNVYNNSWIWGITADPEANLYAGAGAIASASTIIRISPTNPSRQQITCISYAGVNVTGNVRGLLFDGSANLYVVDNGNDRVLLTRPKTFIFGGSSSIVNGESYFNTDKRTTYLYDISSNELDASFLLNPAECFKKGTKILCENDMYVPIEELKIGDLVKTYKHGYQKVIRIANNQLCDYPQSILSQLYTYSRKKNPYLKEDLHLTGGHSLLLASLTEEESNGMKQVNWQKEDFMVEDKYKLLSYLSSELCIAVEQNVEIYNFTLEPPENAKPSYVYGIYANGILAESCSRGAMDKSLGEKRMLCDSSKTEQE
jgi:hypothetical protein